jgi:hypothetical protein
MSPALPARLAHYKTARSARVPRQQRPCAKPLNKLLKPAEFVVGMHDRCDIHKQFPRSTGEGNARLSR